MVFELVLKNKTMNKLDVLRLKNTTNITSGRIEIKAFDTYGNI